jgi:hypothetical protein
MPVVGLKTRQSRGKLRSLFEGSLGMRRVAEVARQRLGSEPVSMRPGVHHGLPAKSSCTGKYDGCDQSTLGS